MSGRRKYLYRVTATWPARNGWPPHTGVWHYQSKAAADHRAAVLREGRAPVEEYDHLNGYVEKKAEIHPANTVTIERSEPVVWTTT